MQRLGKRRARSRQFLLWVTLAGSTLLCTSCVAPSHPAGVERERGGGTEELTVASPDPLPAMPPSPHVGAPRQDALPMSFDAASSAPAPTSPEFAVLSDPLSEQGMTLEEVLRQTLDCHPLLRARGHEIEAARGRLVTAGLLTNPQWVLDSESPVHQDDPTVLSTRLTFLIPTGRKRHWGMEAAEAGVARSRAALERETELVLAEAADAAIEVLYLQELERLQAELIELAAQTATVLEGQFQSGSTTYVTMVKARLDAGEIELARLATRSSLEQARVRLSRAAGLSPACLVQMRGALEVQHVPAVPLECLLAEAECNRPELAESRAALLESQRELAQARAAARPDLVLGPRVQNAVGEPDDRVGARFSVDVPLFDRNQGGIVETAAVVRTRSAMLDAAQINTLSDVAAAYLELQATQSRLDFHRTRVQPMVEQAETTVRAAAADSVLDPGQISMLLEQLAKMRVEQLELRYLHNRLRMRLEILLGCPLGDLSAAR